MLQAVDDFIKARLELIKFNYKTTGYGSVKVYPYIPERDKGDTLFPCYAFQRLEVEERLADRRPGHSIFIPVTPSITGATNTSPIRITSAGHGLVEGQTVTISGVVGNTSANGTWVVANTSTNQFDIKDESGANSKGNGSYVSGGTIELTTTVPFSLDHSEPAVSGPIRFTEKPYPTPVNISYEIHTLATVKAHNDWLVEMFYQAFPPGYQPTISECCGFVQVEKVINNDELSIPLYSTCFLFMVYDLWLDRIESYGRAPLTAPDLSWEATGTYE